MGLPSVVGFGCCWGQLRSPIDLRARTRACASSTAR